MNIKFLQWNIWYKEQIDNVILLIKEIDPDIICLQELAVNCVNNPGIANTAEYIAEQTGMFFYFEEAQRWQDDDEMDAVGNGIFSKHPIVRKFAKHVQEPTKDFTDYSHEGRIYIECDIQVDDKLLTVGTTHLSYVPWFKITDKKKIEVNNLYSLLKSNKYIFSGDLNSTPDSYTIEKLSSKLSNCGPDYSENSWTTKPFEHGGFKENELNWRLDYVFASSDLQCDSSEIVKTNFSDHLPIVASLKL
jgi:endonuclease/exonuclease/phosphatase family metal-dependent hydrolase